MSDDDEEEEIIALSQANNSKQATNSSMKKKTSVKKKKMAAIEEEKDKVLPINSLLKLFDKKHICLKVFWSICLLLFTSYCIYSIYLNISSYFEFAVVTQIQTFYQNPTPFPAITICHLNMMSSHEGIAYANRVLANNSMSDVSHANKFLNYSSNQKAANIYGARRLVQGFVNDEPDHVKRQLGINWHLMSNMCIFAGSVCYYERDFKWYFHSEYGNCYQFNAERTRPKMSSRTGRRHGLNMMLFVGSPSNTNSITFETGVRLFIHNQSDSPSTVEGISVMPGTSMNIALSKKFHTKLPKPFNDCHDVAEPFDSFFYAKTLELGYAYKQKTCLDLCVQDYLIRQCNCSDPSFPRLYNNVSYCKQPDQSRCLFFKFVELYDTNANEHFVEQCPIECSHVDYEITTMSASSFPSDDAIRLFLNDTNTLERFEYIGKDVTLENVRKYYLQIHIYFEDLKYTLVSEKAKQTLYDLMSSIGGTLGLYLGLSFLSFIEIFEIIIIRFILFIQTKHSRIRLLSSK